VASGNRDLHGSAPDKSSVVLLLIDVINDLEFPGSIRLLRRALPAAKRIAALKKRARKHSIPVVYVNDNFGRWRSDFRRQVQHCIDDDVTGRPIATLLRPDDDDYFVLKPKHSGFFSTQLDILLDHLGAETLILTGFAGNLCVLYTANDAYMRDYNLIVPRDCVASETPAADRSALDHMRQWLKADTRASTKIRFPRTVASR
jgi:nicotinamidase-related amidase